MANVLSKEELENVSKAEVLTPKTIGKLPIETVAEQPFSFNMLIYGDSGVGKTVLCGSASVVPEMCPVLFIDAENGTLSLRNTYPNVERVRVKSLKQVQAVYDELLRNPGTYKTVVLDSLTELQQVSMTAIMADVVRNDSDREPDVPGQREWGINLGQTRRLVRGFRDLPDTNVIFTALTRVEKTNTGYTQKLPGLTGKAVQAVPAFIDQVHYMYVKRKDEKDTRYLLTQKTQTEDGKDRSGNLPMVIEEPTMQILYSKLTAKDK